MLIAILVGVAVIYAVISLFSGALKKILEIISVIFRFCVGGAISMIVLGSLQIQFSSQWWFLLFVVLGAVLIFTLVSMLSAHFRLIGYSINYFSNSFLILIVTAILGENFSVDLWVYALILFLFPRLMWIGDRFASTSEFSHTSYDGWSNTFTEHYIMKPVDWWVDSGDSWKWIPFQIVISALFYMVGSATLGSIYKLEETGWAIPYIILAVAINVVFDLLVFRKLEEKIFE